MALLPAAVAVVLLVAAAQGRIGGGGWDAVRWAVTACAAVVLLGAAAVSVAIARARPAVSPTVPLTEQAAPDLYRLVRDLADRLDVPAPSAIALTPDCDSWLEDRTHRSAQPAESPATRPAASGGRRHRRRWRPCWSSGRRSCGGCGSLSYGRCSPRSSRVQAPPPTPI